MAQSHDIALTIVAVEQFEMGFATIRTHRDEFF